MRMRTIGLWVGLVVSGVATAGGIPLVDSTGAPHGSAVVSTTKGTVKMKITGLPAIPAVPPGATLTAYVYKAYLTSSTDAAVEIFVVDVYPNGSGAAKPKVKLGGDVSRLGLDRLVVTAFSKDAHESADVLTASLQ